MANLPSLPSWLADKPGWLALSLVPVVALMAAYAIAKVFGSQSGSVAPATTLFESLVFVAPFALICLWVVGPSPGGFGTLALLAALGAWAGRYLGTSTDHDAEQIFIVYAVLAFPVGGVGWIVGESIGST